MGFKDGVETLSSDGKRRRDFLPGLGERERDAGQLLRDLSEPPADAASRLHDDDHDLAAGLRPDEARSPSGTSIPTRWRSRDFVFQDAVDFWDRTNREDWAISEQSYLGISSRGYEPGPYSEREKQLWEFDQFVLSRLNRHEDCVDSAACNEGSRRQRRPRAASRSKRRRGRERRWHALRSWRSSGSIRRFPRTRRFASLPSRSTGRR